MTVLNVIFHGLDLVVSKIELTKDTKDSSVEECKKTVENSAGTIYVLKFDVLFGNLIVSKPNFRLCDILTKI